MAGNVTKRKTLNSVSEDSNDDWRVESDLRCVMECEVIEADPARMKKVRELAKKKMLEIASIASGESE